MRNPERIPVEFDKDGNSERGHDGQGGGRGQGRERGSDVYTPPAPKREDGKK